MRNGFWGHERQGTRGVQMPDEGEHGAMGHLDIGKLRAAKLEKEPFEFVVVPAFLVAESIRRVNATFPSITKGGSYPIESLRAGMVIREVIEELDSAEFQAAVAEKFGIDLTDKPKMYSVRGYLRSKDGSIHTDSKDKIITVLLYLNEQWPHRAGRLRLLRNGTDLENYVVEVPPDNGTMLLFRRAENSWHGHHPYEGQRRALQMNWMTGEESRGFHALRHRLSAAIKMIGG